MLINNIPSTFSEFRTQIAEVLKLADAPKDMISEIADIEYEGVGLPEVLLPYWEHISVSMRNSDLQLESTNIPLIKLFRNDLYDMTLEIVKEYNSPINYSNKKSKKLDDVEFANKLMNIWTNYNFAKKRSINESIQKAKLLK